MGVDLSAQHELRHRRRELQQQQSVHRERRSAGRRQRPGRLRLDQRPALGDRDHARDGKRRRGTNAGRAQSHGDLGRVRDIHCRRRIPIPAGYSCDPTTHVCTTQISYKKFGISLNFTPVVLSEGRISLRVMTEVSELSTDNAITVSQALTSTTTNSITIPSIRTRRAETTLEIPSGGSHGNGRPDPGTDQAGYQRLPGLDSLPVLGGLFRSQDFVNNETELMVLVTPYIVRAVPRKNCRVPMTDLRPHRIPNRHCWPRSTGSTGISGRAEPVGNYPANFGFIID